MEILVGREPVDPPRSRRDHFQIVIVIFRFSKIFPIWKLDRFP